jgi:hypothetical protein
MTSGSRPDRQGPQNRDVRPGEAIEQPSGRPRRSPRLREQMGSPTKRTAGRVAREPCDERNDPRRVPGTVSMSARRRRVPVRCLTVRSPPRYRIAGLEAAVKTLRSGHDSPFGREGPARACPSSKRLFPRCRSVPIASTCDVQRITPCPSQTSRVRHRALSGLSGKRLRSRGNGRPMGSDGPRPIVRTEATVDWLTPPRSRSQPFSGA